MLRLLTGRDIPCGITEELNTPPPFILYNVDFSKCSDKTDDERQNKKDGKK